MPVPMQTEAKLIKRWLYGQDSLIRVMVNGKHVKDTAQLRETKDGLKDNEASFWE